MTLRASLAKFILGDEEPPPGNATITPSPTVAPLGGNRRRRGRTQTTRAPNSATLSGQMSINPVELIGARRSHTSGTQPIRNGDFFPANRKRRLLPASRIRQLPPTNRKRLLPPANRKRRLLPANRNSRFPPANRKRRRFPASCVLPRQQGGRLQARATARSRFLSSALLPSSGPGGPSEVGARLVGLRSRATPAVSLGPKLSRPSAPARSLPASRSLPWRRAWTSPNSEWGGRALLGLARPRSCPPRPAPSPLSHWTRPGARERGNYPLLGPDHSLAQVRGAGGRAGGSGASGPA